MPFKDIEETHEVDGDGKRPMKVHLTPARRYDVWSSSGSDAERCITCPANVNNGGLKGLMCTGVDPTTGRGTLEYSSSTINSQDNTACGVEVNELERAGERNHIMTQGKTPIRRIKTKRQVWYPNPRN
ncbi:MAG TPA: hypothetical protein VEW42_01790 [Candidatus Eisenbacteria bacterium]|nr:hypothetical protein [Candidatus Eisenbacteria bacterium]